MKNYKLHVPEGFKDTYGYEMQIKKEIENRVLGCFNHYGYTRVFNTCKLIKQYF